MKYSFLGISSGEVMFVLKEVFSIYQLLGFLLLIILLFFISSIKWNKKYYFSINNLIILLIFITSIITYIFFYSYTSNIYTNTLHDSLNYLKLEKFKINGKLNISKEDLVKFDKSFKKYPLINNRDIFNQTNKKVFIFVMEQTSYNTFHKELSVVKDKDNFFLRVKNNSHVFTNYYTRNQDSRTAIWTIYNSQFIPFESYIYDWNKYYANILYDKNLIEYFNKNQFTTNTFSAIYGSGLILSAHNWTSVNILKTYDDNNPNYVCIGSIDYAKGCEDMILINDLKKKILENKNNSAFFFQEMIYGHGEEYEKKTGISRTNYYNNYFNEVYSFLGEENMLDDSIIVIVSDHGEKGYGVKQLWNYQLPLIIINKDLDYKQIDDLYSHLSLKDILLSYINKNELPKPEEEIFFIGQTQSSQLGYVNKDNNYFLLRQMGETKFAIINKSENMSLNETKLKTKIFLNYQSKIHNLNVDGNYYCYLCSQNIKKAGIIR